MYLSPLDPTFEDAVVASGPGVHTDEASSALADLRGKVSRGTLAGIARESGERLHLPVLGNPPSAGGYEAYEREGRGFVSPEMLARAAWLVTGQWGPPQASEQYRKRNPEGPGVQDRNALARVPFFQRMHLLEEELGRIVASIRAQQQTKRGGEDWLANLAKMRAAVSFLLSQEREALAGRGRVWGEGLRVGNRVYTPAEAAAAGIRSGTVVKLPLGIKRWGVIAAKGNMKLPFAAYSELPFVTCPGAAACLVVPGTSVRGWCYSIKAWRFSAAFTRQFLNTLANYADREFAIYAATARSEGGPLTDPSLYWQRVEAATVVGPRFWPQFVKCEALRALRAELQCGKQVFLRLFVDGDLNTEDCIVEWMRVCHQLDQGARDVEDVLAQKRTAKRPCKPPYVNPSEMRPHVEVYGYTKCWAQLVNAGKILRGQWPLNYHVNLSSASVYAVRRGVSDARRRVHDDVQTLPVFRGFFDAVDLGAYIRDLDKLYQGGKLRSFPEPKPGEMPVEFSPERVALFARLAARLDELVAHHLSRVGEVRRRAAAKLDALAQEYGIAGLDEKAVSAAVAKMHADPRHDEALVEAADLERGARPELRLALLDAANRTAMEFGLPLLVELPGDGGYRSLRKHLFQGLLDRFLQDAAFRSKAEEQVRWDAEYREGEGAYLAWRRREEEKAVRELIRRKGVDEVQARKLREVSQKGKAELIARAFAVSEQDARRLALYGEKALRDKALSFVLHEVMFAAGLGGSCPLVCGNCYDTTDPTDPKAVHRCASGKQTYKGKVIKIGLH